MARSAKGRGRRTATGGGPKAKVKVVHREKKQKMIHVVVPPGGSTGLHAEKRDYVVVPLSSGSVHIALTYAARDRPGRGLAVISQCRARGTVTVRAAQPVRKTAGSPVRDQFGRGHPETRFGRGLREVHDRYNRGIRQVDGGCQARVARHAQVASTYCQKQRCECPARGISEVDITSCLRLCRSKWPPADAVRARPWPRPAERAPARTYR